MKKIDLSQILKTLIVLIVLFAAFFRFFELNMPDVIEDEDAHIRDAIAYYHNDPFIVPRHHPFKHTPGNMGHPFFHHFLIFFSYKIFNPSYASSRLPAGIMSLIAALSIYYISRKMFNQKTAFIASSLYLMSALPFRHARTANVDCTFAAFGGLSIYYFYKYLQDRKLFDALFVGIFAAVLFSTRLIGIMIFTVFGIYILLQILRKEIKFTSKDLVAMVISLSAFAILFLIMNDPKSYIDGILNPADPSSGDFFVNPFNFDWTRLKGTVISLFPWNFSILLTISIIISIVAILKKEKYHKEHLLLLISLGVFFYGFRFSLERGLIIFLVPASVITGKLIADHINLNKKIHLILYFIFLLIFLPYLIWYGFRTKPLPMPPYDYVTHYYNNRLTMFDYLNNLSRKEIKVSTLPSTLFFPSMNLRKGIELIPVAFRDPATTDYFLTDNQEIYQNLLNNKSYQLVKYSEYKNDMAALFKRID